MTKTVQNLRFSKGEVIVATQGMYSDFCLNGFFVAIKDFDMAELAQKRVSEYVAKNPKIALECLSGVWELDFDSFGAWLIAKEVVVPVKYREVHLGGYEFEDEFGIKKLIDALIQKRDEK